MKFRLSRYCLVLKTLSAVPIFCDFKASDFLRSSCVKAFARTGLSAVMSVAIMSRRRRVLFVQPDSSVIFCIDGVDLFVSGKVATVCLGHGILRLFDLPDL